MGSFFLSEGLVISRKNEVIEFRSRTKTHLFFEDPRTGDLLSFEESQFWRELSMRQITIVKAFSSPNALTFPQASEEANRCRAAFTNLSDLPLRWQNNLERKVTYIRALKRMGITRGQRFLIKDALPRIAMEFADPAGPPAFSTVNTWMRKYESSGGEVHVLISGYANRHSSPQTDAAHEEIVQNTIDDIYLKPTRPTPSGTYRAYLDRLKSANLERKMAALPPFRPISDRTFLRRIKERPAEEVAVARLGRQAARKAFNLIKGHLRADHPLSVVEIDHTPLNLYVIDDFSFLPIGRPWATAIKDRYSGMVLGFFLTFQPPSLQSIFGALKHSLSTHVAACDLWPEIENPWPSFGIGATCVSDRGPDFLSPRYRAAIYGLGSEPEYCERRTPWHKGGIERFFGTVESTFFEAMRGKTFSNLARRGDYDSAKEAVIRFSTLVYLMHKWSADFHNVLRNKRKQARPLDLWMDGIEAAPPPYASSQDDLDIILGDVRTGTLRHDGLQFKYLNYSDDAQLRDIVGHYGFGINVQYVVTNEDLGSIMVKHPGTGEYFSVPCTRPDYANGLTLYQHQYLRKQADQPLERSTAVDTLVRTRASMQACIGNELAAKETATKVRLARIAGMNSNYIIQGEIRSVTQPFGTAILDSPSAIALPAPVTNVRRPRWGA